MCIKEDEKERDKKTFANSHKKLYNNKATF